MKLTAEIADERRTLDLRREGEHVVAEIDGRRYELEARKVEKGVYLLLINGRVYECRVDGASTRRGSVDVSVGGRTYNLVLSDPKRLRSAQGSGTHEGGRAELAAPMPGKVVRVIARMGARVEAGDALLVVEAMKMQNEMKSPKAGTVVELHAREGETVNAGDVLVAIE
jgi:biotin carboxyl carrier protein